MASKEQPEELGVLHHTEDDTNDSEKTSERSGSSMNEVLTAAEVSQFLEVHQDTKSSAWGNLAPLARKPKPQAPEQDQTLDAQAAAPDASAIEAKQSAIIAMLDRFFQVSHRLTFTERQKEHAVQWQEKASDDAEESFACLPRWSSEREKAKKIVTEAAAKVKKFETACQELENEKRSLEREVISLLANLGTTAVQLERAAVEEVFTTIGSILSGLSAKQEQVNTVLKHIEEADGNPGPILKEALDAAMKQAQEIGTKCETNHQTHIKEIDERLQTICSQQIQKVEAIRSALHQDIKHLGSQHSELTTKLENVTGIFEKTALKDLPAFIASIERVVRNEVTKYAKEAYDSMETSVLSDLRPMSKRVEENRCSLLSIKKDIGSKLAELPNLERIQQRLDALEVSNGELRLENAQLKFDLAETNVALAKMSGEVDLKQSKSPFDENPSAATERVQPREASEEGEIATAHDSNDVSASSNNTQSVVEKIQSLTERVEKIEASAQANTDNNSAQSNNAPTNQAQASLGVGATLWQERPVSSDNTRMVYTTGFAPSLLSQVSSLKRDLQVMKDSVTELSAYCSNNIVAEEVCQRIVDVLVKSFPDTTQATQVLHVARDHLAQIDRRIDECTSRTATALGKCDELRTKATHISGQADVVLREAQGAMNIASDTRSQPPAPPKSLTPAQAVGLDNKMIATERTFEAWIADMLKFKNDIGRKWDNFIGPFIETYNRNLQAQHRLHERLRGQVETLTAQVNNHLRPVPRSIAPATSTHPSASIFSASAFTGPALASTVLSGPHTPVSHAVPAGLAAAVTAAANANMRSQTPQTHFNLQAASGNSTYAPSRAPPCSLPTCAAQGATSSAPIDLTTTHDTTVYPAANIDPQTQATHRYNVGLFSKYTPSKAAHAARTPGPAPASQPITPTTHSPAGGRLAMRAATVPPLSHPVAGYFAPPSSPVQTNTTVPPQGILPGSGPILGQITAKITTHTTQIEELRIDVNQMRQLLAILSLDGVEGDAGFVEAEGPRNDGAEKEEGVEASEGGVEGGVDIQGDGAVDGEAIEGKSAVTVNGDSAKDEGGEQGNSVDQAIRDNDDDESGTKEREGKGGLGFVLNEP